MRSVSSHETEGRARLSCSANAPCTIVVVVHLRNLDRGGIQGGGRVSGPLVSFRRHLPSPCLSSLHLHRERGFSFHPRTKSRIVTPVVSQLGQSYLIKSSRGRSPSFLLSLSLALLLLHQVLIKLFLLLRQVFIISRARAPRPLRTAESLSGLN